MDKGELLSKISELGISSKEAAILVSLLTLGPMKIADLSKRTAIPRSSIYRYVTPLEQKGLVSWVMGFRSNLLAIGNLSILSDDLERQRSRIKAKEDALKELVDFAGNQSKKSFNKTTINYYEGVNGIRQLIWNSLNTKGILKAYTNATRRDIVGKTWLDRYCLEFLHRGLEDRVLCDLNYAKSAYTRFGGRSNYFSPVSKYNEVSEERVFRSPLIKITGEIYIYDDVVATYSWEKGYLVGTEIVSRYIASTQHSIFDLLWDMTQPIDNIKNYPGQG